MLIRRGALWALLALLGIVLVALCTWSIMQLAGQRIGLASAPVSVVRGLAPASAQASTPAPRQTSPPARPDEVRPATTTVTVTRTVEVPVTQSAPAVTPPPVQVTHPPLTAPATTRTTTPPTTVGQTQRTRTQSDDRGSDSGATIRSSGSSRSPTSGRSRDD